MQVVLQPNQPIRLMLKPTISEHRSENISDFTGGGDFDGSGVPIGYRYPASFLHDPAPVDYKAKFETAFEWMKKLFLFVPGALFLYFTTFSLFVFSSGRPWWSMVFLFWLAAGSFTVWLGLGEIKKIKHLAIPASIIVLSLGLAGILSLFPQAIQIDLFLTYSMYFLPLVFMVPVMVKSFVDRKPAL